MIKIENAEIKNSDEEVTNTSIVWDSVPGDYDGLFDVIVEFKDGTTYSYVSDHEPLKRGEVDIVIGGDLMTYYLDHPEENPKEYRVVKYEGPKI